MEGDSGGDIQGPGRLGVNTWHSKRKHFWEDTEVEDNLVRVRNRKVRDVKCDAHAVGPRGQVSWRARSQGTTSSVARATGGEGQKRKQQDQLRLVGVTEAREAESRSEKRPHVPPAVPHLCPSPRRGGQLPSP